MTSDLRPVDMHTTIPDALRREIDDDLAAGGERARKWRPRVTRGVTRILALDGPYAGGVGTPTGLAGWTYDDGNFGRIFISADGGTPWLFGLDESPPTHPVTAWVPVGSTDRPRGLDLQATNPRPNDGDRVIVLDSDSGQGWIGNVSWPPDPAGPIRVLDHDYEDDHPRAAVVTEWAILPPAASAPALEPAVTSPAREAAYDAADKVTTVSRRHVEAIVDAALNALAGDLHIAESGGGPAVFDPARPPGARCIIGPMALSDGVWALLEAVIPTRDEA